MCLSDGFTKEMEMQTPFSVKGWDWGHALTLTNYLSICLLSKESGTIDLTGYEILPSTFHGSFVT